MTGLNSWTRSKGSYPHSYDSSAGHLTHHYGPRWHRSGVDHAGHLLLFYSTNSEEGYCNTRRIQSKASMHSEVWQALRGLTSIVCYYPHATTPGRVQLVNRMSHQQFLEVVRSHELLDVLSEFPAPQDGTRRRTVLEIGAGTGQQARMLEEYGFDVTAIDLPTSHYRRERVFDVIEYDGRTIPCATDSIDVVFSSNVLEHVAEIDSFLDETIRVMASNGLAIHILPSSSCRMWSIPAHYVWLTKRLFLFFKTFMNSGNSGISDTRSPVAPSTLREWIGTAFPVRHGERGTALTEALYYSKAWWRSRFENHHLTVDIIKDNHLFYTMANSLTDGISIEMRQRLSRLLGSSCRIYILRKSQLRGGSSGGNAGT